MSRATVYPAVQWPTDCLDARPGVVITATIYVTAEIRSSASGCVCCSQIKFTPVREGETDGRYCDPVTGSTLTNSSKLVLIKPTGALKKRSSSTSDVTKNSICKHASCLSVLLAEVSMT